MIIDISVSTDNRLYDGCSITMVAGRANLTTPVADAVNLVGSNIHAMIAGLSAEERDQVVLTGPAPVWAYLVVFHAVVHRFRTVSYNDGRSGDVLIAAHG
jgi:hypothetical protein